LPTAATAALPAPTIRTSAGKDIAYHLSGSFLIHTLAADTDSEKPGPGKEEIKILGGSSATTHTSPP
jgi:hypothetical protein